MVKNLLVYANSSKEIAGKSNAGVVRETFINYKFLILKLQKLSRTPVIKIGPSTLLKLLRRV